MQVIKVITNVHVSNIACAGNIVFRRKNYRVCMKQLGATLLQLLLLRRAPRALEGGPSERQHLLWVGLRVWEKNYQMCVTGGHRGLDISAASARLFAAPPCTAGT